MHLIFLCNGYYGVTILEKFYYFIPVPIKSLSLRGMPWRAPQSDSVHFTHSQSLLRALRDQITFDFSC